MVVKTIKPAQHGQAGLNNALALFSVSVTADPSGTVTYSIVRSLGAHRLLVDGSLILDYLRYFVNSTLVWLYALFGL